jgi:hypothetical protein
MKPKEESKINQLKKKPSTIPPINAVKPQNKKLQDIGKLLVNKIDDILGNPMTSACVPDSALLDKELLNLDNQPVSKSTVAPKKKKKKKKPVKDTFVTYLEVEGKTKESYMEEKDKKIKEALAEFDSIDSFLGLNDEKEYLAENPQDAEEVEYYKNLIKEVDDYRNSIKEEFDELKYLIKFVDKTKGRINRHKYGVSNMFSQIGLKKKVQGEELSDKEEDEEVYYTGQGGIYDKSKNLAVVKDRLFNMQGGVLSFYKQFNTNMKEVEKYNKDNPTVPNAKDPLSMRPTTTTPKLRSLSKPK